VADYPDRGLTPWDNELKAYLDERETDILEQAEAWSVPRVDGGRVRSAAIASGTNESALIQAEIDALATFGGGVLELTGGTIRSNLTVPATVELVGAGIDKTIIKSVAGSDLDVIRGVDFATLTGKSYASGDIGRGAYQCGVRNMTIDGDKATNSSGFGIRLWGRTIHLTDLVVQNCAESGIWTEFTTHDAGTSNDLLESNWNNIKTVGNDDHGWIHRGPHDSVLNNFVTVGNGGWGFVNATDAGGTGYKGGIKGMGWNSWLNTLGSYNFGAEFDVIGSIASGSGGVGLDMAAGLGSCTFTGTIGGHDTGIIARGTLHRFDVTGVSILTLLQIGSTGGGNEGGILTAMLRGSGIDTAVKYVNRTGPCSIEGRFAGDVTTLLDGTPGNQDRLDLSKQGSTTVVHYLPGTSVTTGTGWSPQWPSSNGVLRTDDTVPILVSASRQLMATGTGKTVDQVITALQTLGLFKQS
jgi:hypothetical protein